jgi:hypothetical protein
MKLKLTIKPRISDIIRGINDFKKGYHVRTIKDEKGDLVTDSHSNMARWRNHISQLLNVCGVNDVRHTEIQEVEPLVHYPSVFEVGLAIEKLKSRISPRTEKNSSRID